ncbi:hypothetical protein F511_36736 [Dorcoceras hygrometricum]|uniref:Uncharacterized protein n=1 Tax=Dorcoceras hygrometricum TaxID=472368 RepID=A0A2Z7BBT7_9LAMI|nr:hypothetical protein F511_36736 [Dorcoceras hygrometricum]
MVDCGRLRQSGPRPETGFLRQPALEGLTRSAQADSSHQDWPEQIPAKRRGRRRAPGGGGEAFERRGRRLGARPALEGLTRSAWMDSPRQDWPKQITAKRRRRAPGGGEAFERRGRRLGARFGYQYPTSPLLPSRKVPLEDLNLHLVYRPDPTAISC